MKTKAKKPSGEKKMKSIAFKPTTTSEPENGFLGIRRQIVTAKEINRLIKEAATRGRNVYAYAKPGQIRIATPFRIIRAAGENLYTINGTRLFASSYTITEA